MGLIAEPCTETLIKGMDEVTKGACGGLFDENVRVKYASLYAMTEIFVALAP